MTRRERVFFSWLGMAAGSLMGWYIRDGNSDVSGLIAVIVGMTMGAVFLFILNSKEV